MHCSFDTRNLSLAHLKTSQRLPGCLVSLPKAQLIICCTVFQMRIVWTPGFLSKAISQQTRRGEIDFGSTSEVQILLATSAKELQSSLDVPMKDVHSLLNSCASMPDGLADLVVCIAAD